MGQQVSLYTESIEKTLRATVHCEACGHEYFSGTRLATTNAAYFSAERADDSATRSLTRKEAALKRRAERGDFRWITLTACPECKYVQSWALKSVRASRITNTVVLAGLAAFVVSMFSVMQVGISAGLAAAGVAAVAVVALRIPGILKLGKNRAEQVNIPEVQW